MAILNVTPDSFSDGGQYLDQNAALSAVHEILSLKAADIIDIGGESTRPEAKPLDSDTECERILPIVTELSSKAFLSIDTFRSKTAAACLNAGAKMINDVSALRYDREMVSIVKEHESYICLMYSKEEDSHPHATSRHVHYDSCLQTITDFLKQRIDFCLDHGIAQDKIIIDPGMGAFISSNAEYSWEVLSKLGQIKESLPDFPLLIGVSRKGFLGGELSERDPISQLVAVAAATNGADIIRTHNIPMAHSFFKKWKKVTGTA